MVWWKYGSPNWAKAKEDFLARPTYVSEAVEPEEVSEQARDQLLQELAREEIAVESVNFPEALEAASEAAEPEEVSDAETLVMINAE